MLLGRANRSLFLILSLLVTLSASAAEVQFEGAYRARARLFDTLSLDRTLTNTDGAALYVQHRLWLKPRFVLSDKVALFTEVKGLDNLTWGRQPNSAFDVATQTQGATVFYDDLSAPTSSTDETTSLLDFTLWRAWGEVHAPIGRFSFGRMPVHWGMGIWQNNGLGEFAEYGDTTDRVAWENLFGDSVYLQLAVDANTEGFVNQTDDTTSFNASVAYRSEKAAAGLSGQYRRTPLLGLNLFNASLQADAEMGVLELHTEAVAQVGSGDLDNGFNDVQIAAFGAVVQAGLHVDPWVFQVEGGFASGDGNNNDTKLKTFTFDRDYNVGLMLFEQAMPTLAAAAGTDLNQGRTLEAALSGNAVSNALYLRPTVSRQIVDGLTVEAGALLARTAKMPDSTVDRKKYGMEFDLGATYSPFEHFDVHLGAGAFLPGTYYKNFSDDTFDGFSQTAFGAQLATRIHF
jgi:hypothetical protein